MNICFLSYRFPGIHNKTDFVFVKKLVDEIAKQGHSCYVLSPYNVLYYKKRFEKTESYVVGQGKVTIYRPMYLSFSTLHIGNFNFSNYSYYLALRRAFRMMNIIPDVMYGHFWGTAYSGYEIAKKYNIPLFVATGESEIKKMFNFGIDLPAFRDYVKGVICVSTKNRDESIELGLTTQDKCIVCPNAVDSSLFYKHSKLKCRQKLGYSIDGFIVAFLGWFNERKGVLRVSEALSKIEGANSLFIGKGELDPDCNGILFKGSLTHNQIPLYLGAADCFVLPTLHEGCCNAVIEALSCGLPVISSDLPFNWDVLDNTNSILVDPNNVEQIANAIRELQENISLREQLSRGALLKASSLSIEQRASCILNFIRAKIDTISS